MVLAITVMTVPTFASADSSQRKPNILLVHGAWADGSSWSHIIPILQREDYTVVAPANPLRGMSWAVIGTQDQAIPPTELTFMAQRAQSKITNVLAGHLSMITQPRVVADVIREAADATC